MTDQEIEVPRRRWFLRWQFQAVVAGLVAVAAAVTVTIALLPSSGGAAQQLPGLAALAKSDPNGAEACLDYAAWLQGKVRDPDTGKPYSALIEAMAVADSASKATDATISAAVGTPALTPDLLGYLQQYNPAVKNFRVANLVQLHSGCSLSGVTMPQYTDEPR